VFRIVGTLALALVASTTFGAPKGDARNGERVYAVCLACHSLQAHSAGPKHCGLVGRKAGTAPGYDYSPAMRGSKIVWDGETLDRFLADPMKNVPGTSMIFSGVRDAKDRADLIAYLAGATVSPACKGLLNR
jgi:cytochrome c